MNFKTIKELFIKKAQAFSKNKYVCTIGGDFYTYEQFAQKTEEVSALLLNNNIKAGDKVGILSQNMPNWGVAFFSCSAYNRVAVPLLPDFSETEIENILEHSEAKAIFISKRLFRNKMIY
jgi:long-chain acyl-CoA synthetase